MANRTNWLYAALMVALLAAAAAWLPPAAGLPYQKEIGQAGIAVATSLLVVTLFVERSMAAINSVIWGEDLRVSEIGLMADDDGTRAAAAQAMARVLTARERLRVLLSFGAGMLISGAGARTLEGLLDLGSRTRPPLLTPIDVVLTAGLIAGGSNGLAFLLQLLKDRLINPPTGTTSLRTALVTTG